VTKSQSPVILAASATWYTLWPELKVNVTVSPFSAVIALGVVGIAHATSIFSAHVLVTTSAVVATRRRRDMAVGGAVILYQDYDPLQ